MNLKELLKQLEEGKITQEEFNAKAKELAENDKGNQSVELSEEIKKQIQSEVDKVRTAYSNEIKKKDEEINKLKEDNKAKLTDAEKKELEKQEAEQKLIEREKAVELAENKLKAISLLGKYGLNEADDKGELTYLSFILGSDENEMDLKCQTLKASLDRSIENKVSERFKENGRDMGNQGGGAKTEKSEALKFAESIVKDTTVMNDKSQKANDYYFGKKE